MDVILWLRLAICVFNRPIIFVLACIAFILHSSRHRSCHRRVCFAAVFLRRAAFRFENKGKRPNRKRRYSHAEVLHLVEDMSV